MKRIKISIKDNLFDKLEEYSIDSSMTKSQFVELLILEHTNKIPDTIKEKELITELSNISTLLNEILISSHFGLAQKVLLDQKINEIKKLVQKID